jgi:exodeoxyribonuclease VII large subunit
VTNGILPVGVVLQRIKHVLESDELLSWVWIEGEISKFQIWQNSGHAYFTIKDDIGLLEGTMWKQTVRRQSFIPKVGDQVIVNGSVSVYEQRGQLRFAAEVFQPAGTGLLQAQFEALRQRLEAEGLFDESRKRELPPFPRRIGVATSSSGAVWHDIQHVIERRYPLAELILAPTSVQGDTAPAEIVAAIQRLQDADVDLIIVGRGGGSIEDLWSFNDERVVRAIFASRVPVVSAVGHETDFTLSDFVADLRAPTPSAAAEVVVPHMLTLLQEVIGLQVTAQSLVLASFQERLAEIQALTHRLHQASPVHKLRLAEANLLDLSARAVRAFEDTMTIANGKVERFDALLAALDPMAILRRGFTQVTRDSDGTGIFRASQLAPGDTVRAYFTDGYAQLTTTGIMETSASASGAPPNTGHAES